MTRHRPGPQNALTDIAGITVGHASDAALKSGVTVILPERPATAAVHVMGGAPGTRETDLLAPDKTVSEVHALVLSGGSAFGLDAASGVMDGLRAQGIGYRVRTSVVPIVPAAIIFDLESGGDQSWENNPYAALGRRALINASGETELGTVGAGTGARAGRLKGGLGTASLTLPDGETAAALVVCNALGNTTVGDGPEFWAAPIEIGEEFGGLGLAQTPDLTSTFNTKLGEPTALSNTTIGVVATDAALTKAEAQRLAVAAHDGLARAIVPAHTPYDGDLLFALSTGDRPSADLASLGHAAALCVSRAIARGVFAAEAAPGDVAPSWAAKFGRQ